MEYRKTFFKPRAFLFRGKHFQWAMRAMDEIVFHFLAHKTNPSHQIIHRQVWLGKQQLLREREFAAQQFCAATIIVVLALAAVLIYYYGRLWILQLRFVLPYQRLKLTWLLFLVFFR